MTGGLPRLFPLSLTTLIPCLSTAAHFAHNSQQRLPLRLSTVGVPRSSTVCIMRLVRRRRALGVLLAACALLASGRGVLATPTPNGHAASENSAASAEGESAQIETHRARITERISFVRWRWCRVCLGAGMDGERPNQLPAKWAEKLQERVNRALFSFHCFLPPPPPSPTSSSNPDIAGRGCCQLLNLLPVITNVIWLCPWSDDRRAF